MITDDERKHLLHCSTCGLVAQTGFAQHVSTGGIKHWNTTKAKDLRAGDVVRPAVGNLAIRLLAVYQEEHEGQLFVVARLSTGLMMVVAGEDDVPLMLRERWMT